METSANLKILIVDDNPGNILALQHLLTADDRTLYTARSGNEALKIVLTNPPDLLLLDVHMPGMDGFEVAKTIRQSKRTKDIPIIFATAERKEHNSMMKGFEEGAIDYLFKPLDPEITKAKIAVLLSMQRQKKELSEKNMELEKAHERIAELNGELQKSIASLEEVNKELETFSYSVSHDLRAPLRILNSYARILLLDHADQVDNDAKRILNIIADNAKGMGEMVDKLLEFARLGKKAIRKTGIDMNELVETCIKDIEKIPGYHASIHVDKLPPAEGDTVLLTQVWFNLIANAVKYSGKNTDSKIKIGSRRDQDATVYYVKDNGVGFDMAYAGKLFGVFHRLHNVDDFQGTGVGLAIVHRIITKHGGRIWAEGEVDKGATFYFTLG